MEKNLYSEKDGQALRVTEESQGFLYQTAKWSRLLSVIGFIAVVLLLLLGLFFGAFLSTLDNLGPVAEIIPLKSIGMIYVFLAIIYFFPCLYLYQFSKNTTESINYNSEAQLAHAFSKLKSFFKFWGILTLAIIIFYVLIIGLAVAGGLSFLNQMQ